MSWKGLTAMLFGVRQTQPVHKPDPIRGELVIAMQKNERAGENVRQALEDLLAASDKARSVLHDASVRARDQRQ